METSKCLVCENIIEYNPSQQTGKYCSIKCQQTHIQVEKVNNGSASFKTAKTYKLKFGKYECEECGLFEWKGNKLTLHLDHIDGNRKNNIQKNLRWLCPNCHSQTETWGIKNISDEARTRMHEGQERGRKKLYGDCSLIG